MWYYYSLLLARLVLLVREPAKIYRLASLSLSSVNFQNTASDSILDWEELSFAEKDNGGALCWWSSRVIKKSNSEGGHRWLSAWLVYSATLFNTSSSWEMTSWLEFWDPQPLSGSTSQDSDSFAKCYRSAFFVSLPISLDTHFLDADWFGLLSAFPVVCIRKERAPDS